MKRELTKLSRDYLTALRTHLKQGPRASLKSAGGLGRLALSMKLQTLDLAMIHKQALSMLVTPGFTADTQEGMIKRAETFFVEAITPIEKTHLAAMESNVQLSQINQRLRQQTSELAAANRRLQREVGRRKLAEAALQKSERHHSELLAQSRLMQEQLRHLSHQVLFAQEEERKQISRELHDEIAQTLAGINVYLAALKTEAAGNTNGLGRNIARTQRLVEKSVNIVHRFARELRPTVLDDLGLIPALHSFLKGFTKRTHIKIRVTASAAVEELDSTKRTVLYRVAQEALTNVAKHAGARLVKMNLKKVSGTVRLEINDDGKSFQVERVLLAKRNKRLGLIGMRERVEMVGGSFSIESAPGKGTTIRAQIPLGSTTRISRTMKSLKPITVLLAEDHQIVREGLRTLLQAERDLEVVGEAASGRQAVELVNKFHPAVVVMDIAMPLLNGLEATRQILKAAPGTRVLMLSAHSDDAYVEQVMALGAAGYLIKQTAAHILPKAIREVAQGNIYFSPAIAKRFTHHQQKSQERAGGLKRKMASLTSREMEVLQLIAEGKANKETAAELGIGIKTVEKHREHLMEKLNIHDTAGLTRYAISAGIIESSVQLTIV